VNTPLAAFLTDVQDLDRSWTLSCLPLVADGAMPQLVVDTGNPAHGMSVMTLAATDGRYHFAAAADAFFLRHEAAINAAIEARVAGQAGSR
jgi:hypothetical protein